MLAVAMGLVDKVPKLDVGAGNYSQTARLLDEWGNDQSSTIGKTMRQYMLNNTTTILLCRRASESTTNSRKRRCC